MEHKWNMIFTASQISSLIDMLSKAKCEYEEKRKLIAELKKK